MGAMQCGVVALWWSCGGVVMSGSCSEWICKVVEAHCEVHTVWKSHGASESRCGRVAVCVSYCVCELRCLVVTVCSSCSAWELQCVGVAVQSVVRTVVCGSFGVC